MWANKEPTAPGEPATFTAIVVSAAGGVPTGAVEFIVDDRPAGPPVELDGKGRATWTTSTLGDGTHQIATRFVPAPGNAFLASTSLDEPHRVALVPGGRPPESRGCRCMIGDRSDPDATIVVLVLVGAALCWPRRRRGLERRYSA